MKPRAVGSALGVLIGMGLVIYLDQTEAISIFLRAPALKPVAEGPARDRGALSPATPPSSPADPPRLSEAPPLLDDRKAEEIARQQQVKAADEALKLVRAPNSPRDPTQPERIRLRALSPRELANEVDTAVEETANYTEGGVYAPERHRDLYQRINNLWDLTNLTPRENEWLGAAAGTLNELAVRHAEEVKTRGDDGEVIRVAVGLGEWAFRLSNDQEKRLIAAVEAAKIGAGHRFQAPIKKSLK